MENTSAITFPCQFPIKIIGKADSDFESSVIVILNKHFPGLPEGALQLSTSKQGHYIAITATVNAQSQAQLDSVYEELSHSPDVIMAL